MKQEGLFVRIVDAVRVEIDQDGYADYPYAIAAVKQEIRDWLLFGIPRKRRDWRKRRRDRREADRIAEWRAHNVGLLVPGVNLSDFKADGMDFKEFRRRREAGEL